MVTISVLGGGVSTGFVLYLCPSRVFQFVNPALSRFLQCKREFSQLWQSLVFLQISVLFPLSAGKAEPYPGLYSCCGAGWWSAAEEIPQGSHWSCSHIPDSEFLPLPVQYGLCFSTRTKSFVLLSHTPEGQTATPGWHALFLLPLFTLYFSPLLASAFFWCCPGGFFGLFWFFLGCGAAERSFLSWALVALWLQGSRLLSHACRFCSFTLGKREVETRLSFPSISQGDE